MAESSKGKTIGYWIATAIVLLAFGAGGVGDLLSPPEVVQQFTDLGYPAYLPRFLGVCKILGAVAIAAPKFPRIKEWAYAGMCLDLLGATYSHLANGDGADKIAPPIVVLVVVVASYMLRPDDRKLPASASASGT